jgi:hypothetical protein
MEAAQMKANDGFSRHDLMENIDAKFSAMEFENSGNDRRG